MLNCLSYLSQAYINRQGVRVGVGLGGVELSCLRPPMTGTRMDQEADLFFPYSNNYTQAFESMITNKQKQNVHIKGSFFTILTFTIQYWYCESYRYTKCSTLSLVPKAISLCQLFPNITVNIFLTDSHF